MTAVDELLVRQCANWYCFEDAVIMAEIMYCQDASETNATLLAKCFHRAGEFKKAFHLLEGRSASTMCAEARIIMADCALRMGRDCDVERIIGINNVNIDTLISMYGKFTVPMLKLVADSYRRRNRMEDAIEYYHLCLTYAPYMISAFQYICDLGDPIAEKYSELLTASNVRKVLTTGTPVRLDFKETVQPVLMVPKSLSSVPDVPDENGGNQQQRITRQSVCKKTGETVKALAPRVLAEPRQTDSKVNQAQRRTKVSLLPRKNRRLIGRSEKRSSVVSLAGDNQNDQLQLDCPIPNLKKQKAEFGSRDSIKENTKVPPRTTLPGRGPITRFQQRQQNSNAVQQPPQPTTGKCSHQICQIAESAGCCMTDSKSIEEFVVTLSWLYSMYFNQKRNDYSKVLTIFGLLPKNLKNMHWTMAQKAIAQTELGHFAAAITTFKSIRLMYPVHLESMAIYSTALWHVRAESDLVNLAQVLADIDLKHPAVWCAIGNHYSLQREHDFAIQMFKRAIQLDPNFRYAFALLGNEYLVSDNHEMAVSCFRILLFHNVRDYRAWYGLGSICFSREKYQLATVYFDRALSVNPSSTVLMCHAAVTLHVRGYTAEALKKLTKAVKMDPSNSLCRFHRAGVLYSMRNFSEALKELQAIEEIVPNESLVFHMLSKVYARMKNEQLFLTHVSWAMKLDAKGAHNTLKDTIDRFYSCDDEDTTVDNSIPATSENTSNAITSMSRMFRSTPLSTIVVPTTESSTNSTVPSIEFYEHMTVSSEGDEIAE